MSSFPKSIMVLGRNVSLSSVKKMPGVVGQWDALEVSIDIVDGQDPIEERDTVLHEVMHAILHCQGRENGGDGEELYVRALAAGVLMVLRDNPKFVKYLTREVTQGPA